MTGILAVGTLGARLTGPIRGFPLHGDTLIRIFVLAWRPARCANGGGTLGQVLTWAQFTTGVGPGTHVRPDGRLRRRGQSGRCAIDALNITLAYAEPPR
jgi:hypothetical protein